MLRLLIACALALSLTATAAGAETPRVLSWQDLVPRVPAFENPFENISEVQRYEIGEIIQARRQVENGVLTEIDPYYKEIEQLTEDLKSQGLDVEALILAYDDLMTRIDELNSAVVGELDGKLVRIPGYALPLEAETTDVDELLLVPYVGACIHVPPPPPNQMVFVTLSKPFRPRGLFEPVWITGRLSVAPATRSLSLVDGAADVGTAYTLQGVLVEPYKESEGG